MRDRVLVLYAQNLAKCMIHTRILGKNQRRQKQLRFRKKNIEYLGLKVIG